MNHRLIRASAGTGKTWQLSGHFLRELFEGARPESILATTFTRKAAGEILGRVLLRLAQASMSGAACAELATAMHPLEVTPERAAALLSQLTGQLHVLRVSTLDSFFQRIARSLSLELGLPPGWSIVDEYTDRVMKQRAIDAVLAAQDPRDSRQLMQMLARGRSRRSVRSLIDEAVEGYYELFLQTDDAAWERIPPSAGLSAEDQELCLAEYQAVNLDGKRLNNARSADVRRFRSGNRIEFLTKGIAGAVASERTQYSRQDLSPELIDACEPLVRHARSEILNELSYRNRASRRLIARFHDAYEGLRRDTGFTRFNEITRLLAGSEEVVDGERVNYRLDSSLRHLLLDEFQDTSLDQWNVLHRMIEPLVSGAAAEETSVFCVGDPKQAIYGWRGGVAEIMDEVEAVIPDVRTEELDESRRSAPAVVDTVNQVFLNLHRHPKLGDFGPACADWEQHFPVHSTHRRDLPGFAELRTAPDFDEESSSEEKAAYQEWVAGEVRRIHRQSPGARIAVLMRTNAGVARLVHQLTGLGIPASEEGGTPPTDSPAILALMSLLYLSSHPGCTASRYHVAHSPLGAVVGFDDWRDDGAAMAVAAALRQRLQDDGYGATVEWIASAVVDDCSERDVLRLRQVAAEAWRYDSAPSLNPADFVALLESSRFSSTGAAPVRVMTIHQSKGLEFDIVVAPELHGSLMMVPEAAAGGPSRAAAPEDVCVWVDRGVRHLLPTRVQRAFQQTTDAAVRGSLCLLYVTLTRAVHALHLLVPSDMKPGRRSLAGLLAAALSEDGSLEDDSVVWTTGQTDWFESVPEMMADQNAPVAARQDRPISIILRPMTQGRRRSLTPVTPSDHAATRLPLRTRSRDDETRAAGWESRARGTLIHAWFEQVQWLDPARLPDEERLREIAHQSALLQLGLADTIVEKLLQEFGQMLQRPTTCEALSASAARSRLLQQAGTVDSGDLTLRVLPERAFAYRHDGRMVQGIIDRLVILEQSGRRLAAEVVDFKTDRCSGDPHQWAALKKSDYSSQLSDYRHAVTQCFGIPAEKTSTSLLLLDADMWLEVSCDSSDSHGASRNSA